MTWKFARKAIIAAATLTSLVFTPLAFASGKTGKAIIAHTVVGQGPEKVIALHNFWADHREYLLCFRTWTRN